MNKEAGKGIIRQVLNQTCKPTVRCIHYTERGTNEPQSRMRAGLGRRRVNLA